MHMLLCKKYQETFESFNKLRKTALFLKKFVFRTRSQECTFLCEGNSVQNFKGQEIPCIIFQIKTPFQMVRFVTPNCPNCVPNCAPRTVRRTVTSIWNERQCWWVLVAAWIGVIYSWRLLYAFKSYAALPHWWRWIEKLPVQMCNEYLHIEIHVTITITITITIIRSS